MKLSTGMHVSIHSYKHDKTLHRIWKKAVVLHQDHHVLVTANNRTRVIEHDGRSWQTKEPAICYFYNDLWFNIIGMMKRDGIYFYCNLSSPYLYDGEAVKYIDYDLDIKVFPDGSHTVLDEREYRNNCVTMSYSDEIQAIIDQQMHILLSRIQNKETPFSKDEIKVYYSQYKQMQRK